MTTKQANILIFLVIVLIAVVALNLQKKLTSQSWEYKISAPSDSNFESQMNEFGEEGWELVTARRATNSYGGASYEVILKRPLK
ncbi:MULTISPECIES: DUF4177 domain-containing protein [Gammaproteobacteria]|uniref:DUF4177 domain-containing protein n=1 Tax=Gammaproteobacteria TaxID=1236 RepID=UPI000DD0107A|nr:MULTISPECIES: DUF4177 domain-containing protein [Gammaproteobacteria]RTE85502.1 DUF4177 domain-containing protein [Aliidiomarina sp. B3213]TCZ89471.1 DUF4177 domain-containing protein [Lysobacter sp. N42]